MVSDPVRDPSDAEDIAKIEEYLGGDSRAFESLFDKYRERVYRLAFRFVHHKEDALEVAQDVFLRVVQNLGSFKTDSKFYTWLYRITANRAIDFMRQKKARHTEVVEASTIEAEGRLPTARVAELSPLETASEHELEENLARAVESLSEKHRTVFLLHAMENLSYKEIAQVMGSSIGTVMSRLFYARKKLQEALGKIGIDRPASRPSDRGGSP
jgi:RNA polymerase sigma-70 factor (ECF subfamily)